ncbi:MAG: hypothetical protein AAFV19_21805 [Pseudomonadota bacterium]
MSTDGEVSPPPPPLSSALQTLSKAIQDHPGTVRTALCGFDLWLEVMGSGLTSTRNFKAGGEAADGTEDEYTIVVPVIVIGGRIVVAFDPTLKPDAFELRA